MRVRVGIRSIISYYFYLNVHFSPNSFSYRGSYFKLGGEGSQILWIRAGGGGCHKGSRWRCRLVCVGVRVRRSKTGLFGYILYLYFGLFLAQKYIYGRRSIL